MIIELIVLEIDYRENAILSLLNPDIPIKTGDTLYKLNNGRVRMINHKHICAVT